MLAAARERDRAPASLRARVRTRTRAPAGLRCARRAYRGRAGRRGGGHRARPAPSSCPPGTPGAPTISQAVALATRGPAMPAPAVIHRGPGTRLTAGVDLVYFPDWHRTLGWRAVGVAHRSAGRPARGDRLLRPRSRAGRLHDRGHTAAGRARRPEHPGGLADRARAADWHSHGGDLAARGGHVRAVEHRPQRPCPGPAGVLERSARAPT